MNGEIDNLTHFLPQALDILLPGGRMAIISFHSLEDRLVKVYFKEQSVAHKIMILTKKPIVASQAEIKNNNRSRSAKLRVAVKI